MEYAKKLVYLSNQWYNDGLKKANIRDLSGAVISLKKSLQYNRDNIASRNLLGLVYYGRGEVAEALVEWIISKNIKTHGNIANYYIKKVQESPSELDAIDQAVKKYNQCLVYCQQGGEDLAAIQLKKVIAAHPTFLKAYQLLALLYLQTEQYAKARQLIRKAHRLDSTNEVTLRYMHELTQLHKDKAAQLKAEKTQTVSYNLGNETIIQPVSATLKDNASLLTILNIVIGLVVGAAVVWFLAVPTMKRNMHTKTNREVIVYSEQIAALETEVELLKKEVEGYKATNNYGYDCPIIDIGYNEVYLLGNFDLNQYSQIIIEYSYDGDSPNVTDRTPEQCWTDAGHAPIIGFTALDKCFGYANVTNQDAIDNGIYTEIPYTTGNWAAATRTATIEIPENIGYNGPCYLSAYNPWGRTIAVASITLVPRA